jgi:hypothetical protein
LVLLVFGAASLFLIRRWNPLWTLTAPYLLAALISAATIGKIGSNVNYLLELCAALSLAVGVVIATGQKHLALQSVRGLILIVLLLGIGRMVHFTLRDYTSDLVNRRVTISRLSELSSLIADTPGDILADEYMGMLTLQGRPLIIQPFEMTQLARAGKWDQTPLIDRIKNKEFAAIIIYDKPWAQDRWTQEMFDAINDAYMLTDVIAENKVYKAFERKAVTTDVTSCDGAAWKLPSSASLGIQLRDGGIDFFGQGNEGEIPVYAVADGLVTRLLERADAVAVQYEDPQRPGKKIWALYDGMASADGRNSYISEEFLKAVSAPVKAGHLIGYQGTWSGTPNWPMWVHVRFTVVDVGDQLPGMVTSMTYLDPAAYLGLALDASNQNIQTLRCNP